MRIKPGDVACREISHGNQQWRDLRWPGWYFGLSPGPASIHAHPSGVPCEPSGTACGEHVPGSRRGPSSPYPSGWPSRVWGQSHHGFSFFPPQTLVQSGLGGLPQFGYDVGACGEPGERKSRHCWFSWKKSRQATSSGLIRISYLDRSFRYSRNIVFECVFSLIFSSL